MKNKRNYKIIEIASNLNEPSGIEEAEKFFGETAEDGWENYAIIQEKDSGKILSFWKRDLKT
mgnify:CR=1 FL=1